MLRLIIRHVSSIARESPPRTGVARVGLNLPTAADYRAAPNCAPGCAATAFNVAEAATGAGPLYSSRNGFGRQPDA